MKKAKSDFGFSERLKEAMKEGNVSQGELARRIGISQPAVWRMVNGSSKTSKKLVQIAKYLGVEPEWLESGKGKKRKDLLENKSQMSDVVISAIDLKHFTETPAQITERARAVTTITLNEDVALRLLGKRVPEAVGLVAMPNDGMDKTYPQGSLLFVDFTVIEVNESAVYAFTTDGVFDVCCLEPDGDVINLFPEHERYRNKVKKEIVKDNVFVIGKVISSLNNVLKLY